MKCEIIFLTKIGGIMMKHQFKHLYLSSASFRFTFKCIVNILKLLCCIYFLLICTLSCEDDGPTGSKSSPAKLEISQAQLDFGDNSNSKSLQITNSGEEILDWSTSTSNSWISISPSDGKLNSSNSTNNISVTVDRNGLSPNSYNGNLEISSNGGSKTIFVSMNIPQPPPTIPTDFQPSKNHPDYVTLSWGSSQNADGYKIFRAESLNGNFQYIGTTSSTSWNDYVNHQAKWYYYKVSAYSNVGESPKTNAHRGYRKGWRFDDVSYYNPSNGIGFYYDLYAYGYKNQPKVLAIYAVYEKNSSYYHVPGSGCLNKAAKCILKTPPYYETKYDNNKIYLESSDWHPDWTNNNYQQYIKMRIYRSSTINNLNAPYYDQTAYYPISWSTNPLGQPEMKIIGKLSEEESKKIDEMISINEFTITNGGNNNTAGNHEIGNLINSTPNLD